MSRKFFPGCKIKAAYPEASAWLAEKVLEFNLADEIEGCCRVNHQKLTSEDTAVATCMNCMNMIEEDAAGDLDNIWILIDQTPDFPLPDYHGAVYGLQDCGRAYDRPDVHAAIRSLLKKMNIQVVELPDAKEKSTFCGVAFLGKAPAMDAGFAPKHYVEGAAARGFFQDIPADQHQKLMEEHAADIPVDNVICYCTACDTGLEMGGKHAVNILELIAGTAK